ncbi:hypothetical protein BKA70DRAFT_1565587 [Coprinopsis sp. MPI-PUGE-AT-0042]|nr:hypothetical protein BKA70DRAFT_1565587 [Coprinopsis sp. MPI-PUGE-AT-0042]
MVESTPGYTVYPRLASRPPAFQLRSLYLDTGKPEASFAQKLSLAKLENLSMRNPLFSRPPDCSAEPLFLLAHQISRSFDLVTKGPESFIARETTGRLQHLKDLTVESDSRFSGDHDGHLNTHFWLPNFLDNLPAPCPINKLRLEVRFWPHTEADEEQEFWNSVDARLASRQRFPNLESVTFEVDTEYPHSVVSDWELEAVLECLADDIRRKLFPKLRSGGQLENCDL